MGSVAVRLTETSTGEPGVGYAVEATMTVKARIVIPDLFDDGSVDDIDGRPRRRPPGPRSRVVFETALAGRASANSDADGRVSLRIDTRAAERQLIGNLGQIPGASGQIVEYRTDVRVRQPAGGQVAGRIRRSTVSSFQLAIPIPRRRVVVLDVDGLRWDVLYRHLKRVREAGAGLQRRYRFEPRPDASRETVIEGGKDLRSGLAHLCFGAESNMVDVRLARAAYPSFTFPSHATMFTGVGPGAHGITGNEFATRFGSNPLVTHRWEHLPRAPSLQGFCTSRTGDLGAGIDWFVGGFDLADDDSCTDRNRGLVSDLFLPTVFERLHDAGRRTCVIHNFFHGARRPWTDEGLDQWWHLSNSEIRTIKDVCSDEDVDQYEPFDEASFLKAHLLLRYRPSTIRVEVPDPRTGGTRVVPVRSVRADRLSGRLDGGFDEDRFHGDAHSQGPPDLMTIYVASVDKASHTEGVANQETYLAWFDNLLAGFIDDYRTLRPFDYNNTVFAIVADHGHQDLVPGDGISTEVALALLEAMLGVEPGSLDGIALLVSQELLEGRVAVFGQGMNQYVYVDGPADLPDGGRVPGPLEAAQLLLSTPLRVTPYAALVKDAEAGGYLLLARGDERPVPMDSQRAREVIAAHLDLPPPDEAELAATEARPGAAATERALRERLATDPVGVLDIPGLVAGLAPVLESPIDRSPDVVMLAPERRGFTDNASTHGSFAFPVIRIPMVFCGPAVRDDREVPASHMVDFTPTILSLLGVEIPEELPGRALLDYHGRRRSAIDDVTLPRPPIDDVILSSLAAAPGPPPQPQPRSSSRSVSPAGDTEKHAPVGSGFVVIAVRGRSPDRTVEVIRPAHYRVASAGYDHDHSITSDAHGCDEVHLWHVTIRVPHVPTWLHDAVSTVLAADGVVLTSADGPPELVLPVAVFCDLVEATAQRLRAAAIARTAVAVEATLETADDGDLQVSRHVAESWSAVLDALPTERQSPAVVSDALTAVMEASESLGESADPGLIDAIARAVALPSGSITAEGDAARIEAACRVIERLLAAEDVGEVTGLTWS